MYLEAGIAKDYHGLEVLPLLKSEDLRYQEFVKHTVRLNIGITLKIYFFSNLFVLFCDTQPRPCKY